MNVPDIRFGMNISALQYWEMTGYSAKDVEEGFAAEPEAALFKLEFGSGACNVTGTPSVNDLPHIVLAVTDLLRRVVEYAPSLSGTLVFDLEDCVHEEIRKKVPVLGFSRRSWDTVSLLVPDADYIASNGYVEELADIDESQCAWGLKASTAFWRGRSTGGGLDGDDWRQIPRIRLCEFARDLDDPSILDARISEIVQCKRPESIERIEKLGIIGEYVPFERFLDYKYQIDIDGNACSWRSFFLKLHSNAVVLKVDSPSVEWFFHRAHPWIHYIPVAGDLNNLLTRIEWARAHDRECQEIAMNATRLTRQLQSEGLVEYVAELITRVLTFQR